MTSFLHDPIAVLRSLVSYETVSHRSVMGLADFLASSGEDLGFRVDLYPDDEHPNKTNVVCHMGPEKEGGIILSGHMDVVPTEDQPWDSDPFELTERNDQLIGRGTADMKGFIACTLSALARIDFKALREPLVLIWTYDEETGCRGSHKLAEVVNKKKMLLPKEALIGEPTNFHIFRMHPGHVTLKVIVEGLAAHSSKPDQGTSAIKAMSQVLQVINQLEEELKSTKRYEEYLERPYVTINVGTIKGGQAVNIVPDRCEILFGYRPLPGDNPLELFTTLQNRISDIHFEKLIKWHIEHINTVPALLTPEGQPLQTLLEPIASNPKPSAASFATDAGNLASLGIHSLIFGPGSIDVAHKANEFIEKSALLKGTALVERVIRSRCLHEKSEKKLT